MTDTVLLGMEETSVAHVSGGMLCRSLKTIFFSCYLLEGFHCSTSLFKIPPKVCYWTRVRQHTWPGHCFTFCSSSETLAWSWQCALDRYHILLKYSSPAKLLETGSHSPAIFHTHAAPHHHSLTSVLHCWDGAFTVVVLVATCAEPLSWTNVSWSHLTKDCAPNIPQASSWASAFVPRSCLGSDGVQHKDKYPTVQFP